MKENKTLNVKKTDYDRKITEIEKKLTSHNHDKYITTPEFNTFAASVFNARLALANLVTKTDFDHKLSYLDSKIAANKTKNEFIENEKSYFIGKSHFEEDGTQNYLVFQPLNKYIKVTANTDYISSWKFKALSAETITPPATSDNSLTSALSYYGAKKTVKFTGSCLKEPNIWYTHGTIAKTYIVYELGGCSPRRDDPTLKNCLFGAVTLTKNADINKSGYFGYGIGFDRRTSFFFPRGGFGQNILISGTDMSSSAHIDNRKKDIFVLGKSATQGLEHTLTAEKMYLINFAVAKIKFCLWLHYNRTNSYIFVNGTEL